MGPSARTSMNLNRAILPCPLDFPVAIVSARRNNIHLTICRSVLSTCAYMRAAYPVRPTKCGSFPLRISFGFAFPAPSPPFVSRLPNPGEKFRHSENSHFCRSSCTHSLPINFPRRHTTPPAKFRGNSARLGTVRSDTRSYETPCGTRCRNDISVLCVLSSFFFLFFSIRNAI